MDILLNVVYEVPYFPTKRHKKPRVKQVTDTMTVSIPEFGKDELPVAFIVRDYKNTEKYYSYNGQLWHKVKRWDRKKEKDVFAKKRSFISDLKFQAQRLEWSSYEDSIYVENQNNPNHKDRKITNIKTIAEETILIDGYVCKPIAEPMYVIHTFGLGNNHGGTSFSITNHYNENIHKERYYNALQRKEGLKDAIAIAKRRGDTKYVEYMRKSKYRIDVLMPELVTRNPQKEHGEGDPFLNKLNGITDNMTDNTTKGLLIMMAGINEI